MALARSLSERNKIRSFIRSMLESSFYLEMAVAERLKLIKLLVETY